MTGETRVAIFVLITCLLDRYRRGGLSRGVLIDHFEKIHGMEMFYYQPVCGYVHVSDGITPYFHLCKRRSDCSIPLPERNSSLYLSHFTSHHDQHCCILGNYG